MPRLSKRKTKAKEQGRDNDGKFAKEPRFVDDWGDEDDSGWDDEIDILNDEKKVELIWSDNAHLEKKKRGPYLIGKMKKSTYFDKYGPSGSFTKAAKGTIKISTFINNNKQFPDDFEDVLNDMDEEEQNRLDIGERIESLKTELKEQQKVLTVINEYNRKRAIYKYLKRLGENRKGKIKASKE